MPQAPNKVLRAVVPFLFVGLAALAFWAIAKNSSQTSQGQAKQHAPAPAVPQDITPDKASADSTSAPPPADGAAPPETQPGPGNTVPTAPAANLTYRARPVDPPPTTLASIGSLDGPTGYKLLVEFHPLGAGVRSITLTDHFQTTKKSQHDRPQVAAQQTPDPLSPALVPFAALPITIDGKAVSLSSSGGKPVWTERSAGSFEALIEAVDEAGAATPALRLSRVFTLKPGSYDILLDQKIENLTANSVSVVWDQTGPIDLPSAALGYGGEMRRARFGYLLNPRSDPTGQFVQSSKFLLARQTLVSQKDEVLWPNKTSASDELSLSWVAMTDRYFGVAAHPVIAPSARRAFTTVARVGRLALRSRVGADGQPIEDAVLMRLTSDPITIAAGATADLSLGVYAGPISHEYIDKEPAASATGLGELVIYNSGGPCSICVFDFITASMRAFLGLLHAVFHDWALAVIGIVLCVRTLLHPLTKFQQVNMLRFSKQMQALGPKQKKLQEQYKNDPQKLREEIARLMKEEKVQYSSFAMGCITPFVQMPIWIAMWAIINYTFELRHSPAFFGLFQAITGGHWSFLSDLSEPDHIIAFANPIHVPFFGAQHGINALPFILGVVFFVQQKYLTPPPTAPLTPEQQSQQTMMKWMTVVMFPLFMYNAPSGLALYFLVNSTLGILESRYIRAHAEERGLLNPKPRDASSNRRPGFLERLQQKVQDRQKEAEKARRQQQRKPAR